MTAHDLEPLCVGDRVQQVNTFERFGVIVKVGNRIAQVRWFDGEVRWHSFTKIFAAPSRRQIRLAAAELRSRRVFGDWESVEVE